MSTQKPGLLVLDGNTVKLRILAERAYTSNVVHLDWIRFTTTLKTSPVPDTDTLFPKPLGSIWDTDARAQMLNRLLVDIPDEDFSASVQAHELAAQVCQCLGSDFSVDLDVRKGMDFYKFRWSISLNAQEVGWVGFLAASDSPRQKKQNATIHVNLTGTACTFAAPGWNVRLADLIADCEGVLTRADLALDFFDGYQGGIESVRADYRNDLCNVGGRKLKFNLVGDWENDHDRSIYIGSREAGKVTNIYEKGDQLFGHKANSDWLRFELRYGNKLRVLSVDMLRRPDDFFSGASDWHHSIITKVKTQIVPEPVPCVGRLAQMTVEAECHRNVSWVLGTAVSSMALALKYIDTDSLWQQIEGAKLPGRLKKFSLAQISASISEVFTNITSVGQSPIGRSTVLT